MPLKLLESKPPGNGIVALRCAARGTWRFAFSGNTVSFDGAVFSGGEAVFYGAELSGDWVTFHHACFSGGQVDLRHAAFSSGGEVDFSTAARPDGPRSWFHAGGTACERCWEVRVSINSVAAVSRNGWRVTWPDLYVTFGYVLSHVVRSVTVCRCWWGPPSQPGSRLTAAWYGLPNAEDSRAEIVAITGDGDLALAPTGSAQSWRALAV